MNRINPTDTLRRHAEFAERAKHQGRTIPVYKKYGLRMREFILREPNGQECTVFTSTPAILRPRTEGESKLLTVLLNGQTFPGQPEMTIREVKPEEKRRAA